MSTRDGKRSRARKRFEAEQARLQQEAEEVARRAAARREAEGEGSSPPIPEIGSAAREEAGLMTAAESTRIHEAAHACAAVELRIGLNYVTVEVGAWGFRARDVPPTFEGPAELHGPRR